MTLTDLSATELSRRLAAKSVTSVAIMAEFLDRIEVENPKINAIVSLRPRADLMNEAKAADNAPAKGWLHGLPLAVKDVVATKGLRTTYGSPLFADHVPKNDDILAARLRAAGAIFIGKTNTPEWGHGSHSFNPVHGTTLNPYDLSRGAGGSSGGAAAALAARLIPVADGSDAMGSLRNPSAFCNVYGFRPSWGLVPLDAGDDTFMGTLVTDGPMARTVEDLAHLLAVLAGPNPETPFGRPTETFTKKFDARVKGKRIGWLGDWDGAYQTEPGILECCEAALEVFERLGAYVEPVQAPFPAPDLWQSWITIRAMLNAGSKQALYDDPAKRALIKPETLWEIERGRGLTADAVYQASKIRSQWYAKAAQLFQHFDALALPSAQVWPFPAGWRYPCSINGNMLDTYHRWMEIVIPVSLAGLPCLGMPAGFGDNGLPMGMQLFGQTGADSDILGLGHAYHQATDWPSQRPPVL